MTLVSDALLTPCDRRRREGADRMVQLGQKMHIKFTGVAGQQECHDLPAAIGQQLVAAGPPCQYQLDVSGFAPFLLNVFTRGVGAYAFFRQLVENAPVLI